jgi:hypothetical protein
MKEALLIVAIFAVMALVGSLLTLNFMVSTIPQTSPTQGDLFHRSMQSTISYLAIPAMVILGLSFLAFLVYLIKLH